MRRASAISVDLDVVLPEDGVGVERIGRKGGAVEVMEGELEGVVSVCLVLRIIVWDSDALSATLIWVGTGTG